ncbi:MAG: DUF1553 domain-containing protein [Pirellulaceae bacterium]|nr:DUF1553 domain-containing protein [Pirellulaceae bacterium]
MLHRVLPTLLCLLTAGTALATPLDDALQRENGRLGVKRKAVSKIDDLSFLRRASVDLIGRIPTRDEIDEYLGWAAAERRGKLIDRLMSDDRFADRWTVFFGDMLRLRSNATGGAALTAFVHQAIQNDMPYDELSRRLISTNGKANSTPEVGFVLGDNADPFALAAVTSQVFMGVRIGCAQCHDHPFDVWTREDFYGMAAYFGRTRRVESNLTRVVYTTETDRSVILWPPQDGAGEDNIQRKPMKAKFPFGMLSAKDAKPIVGRLEKLLASRTKEPEKETGPSVDDLLADTAAKAAQRAKGVDLGGLNVESEAKKTLRKIDVKGSLYRHSELRAELADLITSPRNRYFSQSLVNRLWKELVGTGFVEPVDDFREDNVPSHPETIGYLSDEFVASGFDFRTMVRMIVESDAYQRGHAPDGSETLVRTELETKFLAAPMRRMLSESLYDSIVTAGHMFEYKYPAGVNKKIAIDRVRVMVDPGKLVEEPSVVNKLAGDGGAAMKKEQVMVNRGYALEDAIELDFTALLGQKDEVDIERMQVMSREELEAQRLMKEQAQRRAGAKYETRMVKREYDDNPKFNSSLRMAAPAQEGHFLRVFGQTARAELGDLRNRSPSMRQALMMLNGKLTNEAARVGSLEPMHKLLTGSKANPDKAVQLAYREILTRDATATELAEAKALLNEAASPLAGMADLRWVLLNCNEFRFLP